MGVRSRPYPVHCYISDANDTFKTQYDSVFITKRRSKHEDIPDFTGNPAAYSFSAYEALRRFPVSKPCCYLRYARSRIWRIGLHKYRLQLLLNHIVDEGSFIEHLHMRSPFCHVSHATCKGRRSGSHILYHECGKCDRKTAARV